MYNESKKGRNQMGMAESNKKTNMKDMTEGNPLKLIMQFFLPLLAGNVFQQLYNIVDSIVVGKGINGKALAAVGATGSINFLIIGFATGLCAGFGVNMAIEFGAKQFDRLKRVVAMSIVLCIAISVVFTLLSLLTVRPLLIMMKTPDDILADSLIYIRIIFGGIFITVAYNICAALLRSLGDSKTPFMAIVVASFINIALDLLFVIGFKWGVAGAGIATLTAQVASCVYCLIGLRRLDVLSLSKKDFTINLKLIWKLLRIGIPVAFMNSVTAIGCMILQSFVNALGTAYTSAFSATSKIINLLMQPGATLGMAVSTYVSQNLGAGRIDRIREGVKKTLLVSLILNVALGMIAVLFPKFLAGLMISEQEIIDLTPVYLQICGASIFIVGTLFVVRNVCLGLGRTFIPMISGFLELVMRVIPLVLFIDTLGFKAVAYAEVSAWIGAALIIFLDYLHGIKVLTRRYGGIEQKA